MITSLKIKKMDLVNILVVILVFTNCWNANGLISRESDFKDSVTHTHDTNIRTNLRQISNDPYIGFPHLNATSYQSNDAAMVTVPITDADGIKNATLFWEYETIDTTLYNTTMTGINYAFIDGQVVPDSNWLDENGLISETETDWRYGNYTYEAVNDEVISEISVTINAEGPHFDLVYVMIKVKNITSNDWQIILESGKINGTTIDDLGTFNYADTNTTKGYQIFAVAYSDSKVTESPTITLTLYRDEYSGVIPGSGQSTWVNYYIQAYDNTENSTTSQNYSFLMDWKPTITVSDLPTAIIAGQDFTLNVTVNDEDGVGTIEDNSVVAYYRLQEETEWESIQLSHIDDISNTAAAYRGKIPVSAYSDVETTLVLMINASDSLSGQPGYEGTSGLITVGLDNLAPRLIDIVIEGGVSIPDLDNITTITSEVNITATFNDSSGISSVHIFYAIPQGATPIKLPMANMTAITFVTTLPATNSDAIVEYFFEATDGYGNKANTSKNYYYADGIGPVIDTIITYPLAISNITDGIILLNASDNSGLQQAVVWYSLDNLTWSSTLADVIDYNPLILYQKVFSAIDLPFLIPDATTSYVPVEVSGIGKADSAILNVEFEHQQGTDLRIWLKLDDSRQFLIFDREAGQGSFILNIDLVNLGLNQSDFIKGNFTLQIQDYSESYTGIINKYEIELIHYSIPLGYQFIATVPSTGNDTTVYYFVTLTDGLLNVQNSSLYSYYSDGLPPTISLTTISSPLDMQGNSYLTVEAEVLDTGGLSGIEIYYRFSNSSEWTIESMSYEVSSGKYLFDIPMVSEEGIVYYKIRAFDQAGWSTESSTHTVEFTNAEIAISDEEDSNGLLVLGLAIVVLLGISAAGGVYLMKNKELRDKIMRKKPSE